MRESTILLYQYALFCRKVVGIAFQEKIVLLKGEMDHGKYRIPGQDSSIIDIELQQKAEFKPRTQASTLFKIAPEHIIRRIFIEIKGTRLVKSSQLQPTLD